MATPFSFSMMPTNLELKSSVFSFENPTNERVAWIVHPEPNAVIINDFAICNVTMNDVPITREEVMPNYRIPKYWELYTDISNRFKLLDLR